jgi:hypothetical protein
MSHALDVGSHFLVALQFRMALRGSLLKECVEVAGVGLDFAFCVMSLSRVFLFGAQDAASECDMYSSSLSMPVTTQLTVLCICNI